MLQRCSALKAPCHCMSPHFKFSRAMPNIVSILPLALMVATVAAMPVERLNRLTSSGIEGTVQVYKIHFTNSRECLQCDGGLSLHSDTRRDLAKRSPQKVKKFGKKAFIGGKKGFKKLGKKSKPLIKKGGKKSKPVIKKGGKTLSKGAKASAPLSIPAGGGALAFGVPFTGFEGVVVPGLAAAGFDYVAG